MKYGEGGNVTECGECKALISDDYLLNKQQQKELEDKLIDYTGSITFIPYSSMIRSGQKKKPEKCNNDNRMNDLFSELEKNIKKNKKTLDL